MRTHQAAYPHLTSFSQDSCYRSKLKCVGRDNPPCQRCVTGGLECTFDGRRKSKITLVEKYVTTPLV